MTPFDLLHSLIYDSTSRHYNLWLQCVMTLWCVSERSFDLFSVTCSVISLQCLYLGVSSLSLYLGVSYICLPSSVLLSSSCLISCHSNTVFAPRIEDTFPRDYISRCSGFPTIWLLRNSYRLNMYRVFAKSLRRKHQIRHSIKRELRKT
jgi:hypothetical protein